VSFQAASTCAPYRPVSAATPMPYTCANVVACGKRRVSSRGTYPSSAPPSVCARGLLLGRCRRLLLAAHALGIVKCSTNDERIFTI